MNQSDKTLLESELWSLGVQRDELIQKVRKAQAEWDLTVDGGPSIRNASAVLKGIEIQIGQAQEELKHWIAERNLRKLEAEHEAAKLATIKAAIADIFATHDAIKQRSAEYAQQN
jgi:hypothetical protein